MDFELFKVILSYISGPAVGAIIGLVTNYLAVKMLFRPYFPKYIGRIRIPFTPGIIPKRKEALAKGIGAAVGEELFTGEDIKALLCSEKIESRLISSVTESLSAHSALSTNELAVKVISDEDALAFKDKLSLFLAQRIMSALGRMDIGELISTKGKEAILEKKASLGMLGMFLTDGIIDPILGQVRDKVIVFLDEEGTDVALPAIRSEVDALCDKPINECFDFASLDKDKLIAIVRSLYESLVDKAVSCVTQDLDISAVVEKKVIQMPVKDLEALCMKVMKKELNAIVILGGIIGFIIGIINIFI